MKFPAASGVETMVFQEKRIDLVDAYLIACSTEKGIKGVYSFDKDLEKKGLKLLEVK